MNSSVIRLAPGDDVAIARRALRPGEALPPGGSPTAADAPGAGAAPAAGGVPGPVVRQEVPRGHKVALTDLPPGHRVRKYGHVIGVTTRAVAAGEHVHQHNLAMPPEDRGRDADAARTRTGGGRLPEPPADLRRTFDGYDRGDGTAGTRNHVVVLTTVNCSASVARMVARRTEDLAGPAGTGGAGALVDGVVPVVHGTGCGMAAQGPGRDLLTRTLLGYALNPNTAAVVVVGLGCEVNELAALVRDVRSSATRPVEAYTVQEVGGTAAAVAHGEGLVRELAADAARARRTPVGVDRLVLGLQCGGSDAFSGLTANPALGVAGDLLVAAGGTSVLGETPEIYGAEQLLLERAVDDATAQDLLERIRWWEAYTDTHGAAIDANPSPGNKAGGITTILEKSLGAVAKGGHAPLRAVRGYAEPVPRGGLVFMDTPGYDPVSVTGMVAGGVNLVCFTTGRGSVFGSRPVPTVKLATNADLAARLGGDVDLDCSPVLERGVPLPLMGRQVYDLLLDVASGRRTCSEELGMGAEEFVPWQIGAVL